MYGNVFVTEKFVLLTILVFININQLFNIIKALGNKNFKNIWFLSGHCIFFSKLIKLKGNILQYLVCRQNQIEFINTEPQIY